MEKRKEYVKTHRIQSGLSCDLCEEILNEISYIFLQNADKFQRGKTCCARAELQFFCGFVLCAVPRAVIMKKSPVLHGVKNREDGENDAETTGLRCGGDALMRAVMVMFDSLRLDFLPGFGAESVPLPNFERLAARTVAFERNFVGSLPCMPARRELHTGRLNFLHAPWCPLEPFDDSMPELLRESGVHTHLCTDHYHYIQDGGATYHGRYSTYEVFRGQECDRWRGDCAVTEALSPHLLCGPHLPEAYRAGRMAYGAQNDANRAVQRAKADYPQTLTFDAGLDFMRRSAPYDDWFLQIEAFDPHEPFDAPGEFFDPDRIGPADWPPYAPVRETEKEIADMRAHYAALLRYCDESLGRVLDEMDALGLWRDTMLIVNTDHGFLLGEHDWWGKNAMPDFNEICRTPLFIWDPVSGICGERRGALTQTIDLAPTLLEFFGKPVPPDMLGRSLLPVLRENAAGHDYALFGYFNGPVNITDGRYVYMRARVDDSVQMHQYTLMPTAMDNRLPVEQLRQAELAPPFSFTKGCPTLRLPVPPQNYKLPLGEHRLYDLETDPEQAHPIADAAAEARLLCAMGALLAENDAPEALYAAYGIPKPARAR